MVRLGRGIVAVVVAMAMAAPGQGTDVRIPFRAVAGNEEVACGATGTAMRLRDLRLYVHNVRLVNDAGREVPVELTPSAWQFEDAALLDFENGTGDCSNGTRETNAALSGTVPQGSYRGLRFTLGLPFALNHSDLTAAPAPLNLSALAWTWNAGRKFARIEMGTASRPQGVMFHLGSMGCQPNGRSSAPPAICKQPNYVEVELPEFELSSAAVLFDLASLFRNVNLDRFKGCMSSSEDADCAPLFQNLGLPWNAAPARTQSIFRTGKLDR